MPGNAAPRNQRQEYARERALATLARMRRDRMSLSAAAKAEGTNPETIRRYVGTALRQDCPGGRYRTTAYDRIARTLNFLTPQGTVAVKVRGSRTASRIGEYMNAVRTYSNTGDTSAVARFNGKSFRAGGVTYDFITDVSVLDRLIDAGVLAIEGLYRAVQGG
jgi:hypothetical protein